MDQALNSTNQAQNNTKNRPFYESWTFLIVFCILLPLAIRTFFYAPFHIPSGSMKPTLLIGDYIFVSKYAYGYSRYSLPFAPDVIEGRKFFTEPKRGDIIVFRTPSDTSVDYIKRLIGLPGDRVQVKSGILFLNGKRVERKRVENFVERQPDGTVLSIPRYVETLPEGVSYDVLDQYPDGRLDNTIVYKVPPDHYFFMGDNRDNSQDSRVLEQVGFVPAINLVGHAEYIFASTSDTFWKVWDWVSAIRTQRFFTKIGTAPVATSVP